MKIFVDFVNDTFNKAVFIFSVESKNNLEVMRKLIEIYDKLKILSPDFIVYTEVGKSFCFTAGQFVYFIEQAKDITDSDLIVFKKYNVKGFDIYSKIKNELQYQPYHYVINTDEIKDLYIQLFGIEEWRDYIKFNNQNTLQKDLV